MTIEQYISRLAASAPGSHDRSPVFRCLYRFFSTVSMIIGMLVLFLGSHALAANETRLENQRSKSGPEISRDFVIGFKGTYAAGYLAVPDKSRPVLDEFLKNFYQNRDFQPVWYGENGEVLRDFVQFETALRKHAHKNGLNPDSYDLPDLDKTIKSGPVDKISIYRKEWHLTGTIMQYISDLRTGRITPHKYDPKFFSPPQTRAFDKHLEALLTAKDLSASLDAFAPPHAEYRTLRKNLAKYRALEEQGEWHTFDLPDGTLIYPSDRHRIIPAIRERIKLANYDGILPDNVWIDHARIPSGNLRELINYETLAAQTSTNPLWMDGYREGEVEKSSQIYDYELASKVAEFQYFHGKTIDGIIGPETIKELNRSPADYIHKILLSMERWRWKPDELGQKHVRLNIVGFYVRLNENGQDRLITPAIVGEVAHQTPVFDSVIESVKFHPDWTATDNIARRYLIDKIQENPELIETLGYQIQHKNTGEIIPWQDVNIEQLHNIDLTKFQFRQKPGPNNALGLVRFSIKNNYAIFMHDTPAVSLFNQDSRTFSSGCIRVKAPLEMARLLLEEQMSADRVENLYSIDRNETVKTKIIPLVTPVPVYLMYMTTWVDSENNLHFSDDIYKRDKKLAEALSLNPMSY